MNRAFQGCKWSIFRSYDISLFHCHTIDKQSIKHTAKAIIKKQLSLKASYWCTNILKENKKQVRSTDTNESLAHTNFTTHQKFKSIKFLGKTCKPQLTSASLCSWYVGSLRVKFFNFTNVAFYIKAFHQCYYNQMNSRRSLIKINELAQYKWR